MLPSTTSLKALSNSVQLHGARTLSEIGVVPAQRAVDAMKADPMLQGMPFDTTTLDEIVYNVILKGSVIERSAIARHLTPDAALLFQSVSQQLKTRDQIVYSIEYIFKPMFVLLSKHYGVQFVGDADSVAYSLITEFGGFSFADFLICFERVKNGRYSKDTQHIMTRGINAEFMRGWLMEYANDKEAARDAAYNQFRPENMKGESIGEFVDIEKMNAETDRRKSDRLEIQRQADAIYDKWENDLFNTAVKQQGWKYIKVEETDLNDLLSDIPRKIQVKKLVQCELDDPAIAKTDAYPVRYMKPGAIERKVKRIIFEFVLFGKGKETSEFFYQFKSSEYKKYDEEKQGYFEAECKRVLSLFTRTKRLFPPLLMIESVYRKLYPNAQEIEIKRAAIEVIENFDQAFYDTYLPDCIQSNYPRMSLVDYRIVSALPQYIKAGFHNPYKAIFE